MSENLKLLFEDLQKNELSKVGKVNLEMEIRNIVKQNKELQDKLDKIREYAIERITVSDKLYSNQNSLEKVVANYETILSIIESESE